MFISNNNKLFINKKKWLKMSNCLKLYNQQNSK